MFLLEVDVFLTRVLKRRSLLRLQRASPYQILSHSLDMNMLSIHNSDSSSNGFKKKIRSSVYVFI